MGSEQSSTKTRGILTHSYKTVPSLTKIKRYVRYVKKTGYFSHDFESSGDPVSEPSFFPTILGFSFQPHSAIIIPLAHAESTNRAGNKWRKIIDYIGRELIENPDVIKIAFNLKYEYKIWLKYGYEMRGIAMDAMLAKYLLNEERPNDLAFCVKRVIPAFDHYKDDTEQLAKKHGWANIPIKELSKRCALDCDLTLRLMNFYERKLIDGGFYNIFRNLVMPLTRVLAESELRGLDVDEPYLEALVKKYELEITEVEAQLNGHKLIRRFNRKRVRKAKLSLIKETQQEINELRSEDAQGNARKIASREKKITDYLAGKFTTKKDQKAIEGLNFGSPQQMRELLFSSKYGFRFKVQSYTESGEASTGEEDLLKLKEKDKTGFLDLLLKKRGLDKLNSTYVVGMLEKLKSDKRIHGSFLIHGTVTGRLSSREPNLQNIPRDNTAPDIKKMFVPPPGYLLLEVDYSQAELRVMAEWANEEVMIDWFKTGKNVHVATACKMFGAMDRYDEILKITKNEDHPDHVEWSKKKKKAKLVNFGILYGETHKKLAGQLGVSHAEAKKFMDQWFRTFPKITKKINAQHRLAYKQGYISNWFGRKRRLPHIYLRDTDFGKFLEAQRQSVNAFTQGTSSDFTQFSSVLIRGMKLSGKLPAYMDQIYTVHDSIGFLIKPEDVHWVVPIVQDVCSNPETKKYFGFQLRKVYMGVNAEIGRNWGELRGYNKEEDYTKWLTQ